MDLKDLVEISRRYGTDEFALAGGGNTSCKDDETLAVKASGTALRTIGEDGFVLLDRARLAAMLGGRFDITTHFPLQFIEQAVHALFGGQRRAADEHRGLRDQRDHRGPGSAVAPNGRKVQPHVDDDPEPGDQDVPSLGARCDQQVQHDVVREDEEKRRGQ